MNIPKGRGTSATKTEQIVWRPQITSRGAWRRLVWRITSDGLPSHQLIVMSTLSRVNVPSPVSVMFIEAPAPSPAKLRAGLVLPLGELPSQNIHVASGVAYRSVKVQPASRGE